MCLGMRTSSPTVYRRPNPQDIYYNGNIYDPNPQDVIDAILYRKGAAEFMSTELPFYGSYDLMFGPGTKKEIRKRARALDGKIAKDDKQDLQFYPY